MPVLAELHDLNIFLDDQSSDDKEEMEVVSDVPVNQGRVEDVATPDDDVDGITGEHDYPLLYKNSVMNASLGNLDLGQMVNGYLGDSIDLCPYLRQYVRVLQHFEMVTGDGIPSHDECSPQQSKDTL